MRLFIVFFLFIASSLCAPDPEILFLKQKLEEMNNQNTFLNENNILLKKNVDYLRDILVKQERYINDLRESLKTDKIMALNELKLVHNQELDNQKTLLKTGMQGMINTIESKEKIIQEMKSKNCLNEFVLKEKTNILVNENQELKKENRKLIEESKTNEAKITNELRTQFETEKAGIYKTLNFVHKQDIKRLKRKICETFDNELDPLEDNDQETPEKEDEPKKKMKTSYNTLRKTVEVFVACKTFEDAISHALNHGNKGYYNTPIHDNIHDPEKEDQFPHFHLGRNNEREYVVHEEVTYNYHYYYGVSSKGKIAREQPGCDQPDPYFY